MKTILIKIKKPSLKILILGSSGQIGSSLKKILSRNKKKYQITCPKRKDLDLTNFKKLRNYLKKNNFDIVINCVAFTRVDDAELNKIEANKLNSKMPLVLAKIAQKKNFILIHYSTDYVFDGKFKKDYYEKSKTNPLNIYGLTKLKGDLNILSQNCKGVILRVSWVYSDKPQSFLSKIDKIHLNGKKLSIVNDQIGTPTSSNFIAYITKKIIDKHIFNKMTLYNLSPLGKCSWLDLAREYFQNKNVNLNIKPIKSNNIFQKATRPYFVNLNSSKLENKLQINFNNWKIVLKSFLNNGK